MNPPRRRELGKRALDLIEEATQLLRGAPADLAAYYIGTLPFVLGLLYFWAEMSRGAFAGRHLGDGALGLALLFAWMKFWHAGFAASLRARIAGRKPPAWSVRRGLRTLVIQTILQPPGLFVLPLALLAAAVPFGWVFAFFQNVTALADDESGGIRETARKSYRYALLWPGQNHILLIVLAGFGLAVFVNLVTVSLALPQLLKMLFGIESIYTQNALALLNTTFFAGILGLTYLCVDPIIKAVYSLRCFYGEAVHSGADLTTELKFLPVSTDSPTAALALLLLIGPAATLRADDAPTRAIAPQVESVAGIVPANLDRAINDVIHQPKYAWRLPRETDDKDAARRGVIARFLSSTVETIGGWVRTGARWVLDTWRKLFPGGGPGGSGLGGGWFGLPLLLLYTLVVVVASALVIIVYRVWRNRERPVPAVAGTAIFPAPDLADESVGADQLPEDGWVKLGRELLARGELRLAVRAFYFASLAQLAARNLIALAKFKSNRDYERELRRRAHSVPELLVLFGENVSVFDRSWYGAHQVTPELVNHFAANVERIKAV